MDVSPIGRTTVNLASFSLFSPNHAKSRKYGSDPKNKWEEQFWPPTIINQKERNRVGGGTSTSPPEQEVRDEMLTGPHSVQKIEQEAKLCAGRCAPRICFWAEMASTCYTQESRLKVTSHVIYIFSRIFVICVLVAVPHVFVLSSRWVPTWYTQESRLSNFKIWLYVNSSPTRTWPTIIRI